MLWQDVFGRQFVDQDDRPVDMRVVLGRREEQDIDMVVDKYILQFWYKDESLGREKVKRGITTLRKYNYPIYRLEKNATRNPG